MTKKRNRQKPSEDLHTRLTQEAAKLREQAKLLPPGKARQETLRKAKQAEDATGMMEWLQTPGARLSD